MSKRTIAVDIDDVISRSAEGFSAFSNERWGTNLTAAQYSEEWAPLWGVSVEEAIERAKELHDAGAHGTYLSYEEASPVLARLKERYNLEIVTSRRAVVSNITEDWLAKHFAGLFSAVHYVGMWDEDVDPHNVHQRLERTKADLCKQIGAEYLIDDQLKHCLAVAEVGIQAVLFGDYRWNQHDNLPVNVTRASNWDEVERYFDEQG